MYKLNNISTPKKLLETVNDLGVRSNRNLLINPDFAINQRGASSYTGFGSYTVDRWEKRSSVSNSTINITATGVSIGITNTNTTGIAHLRQRLELDFTSIRGQFLTLSTITTTTGTGFYQIRLRQYSDEWTTAVQTTLLTITSGSLSSISALIVENCKRVEVELLSFNYVSGDTVVPTYIKLELGSIATPFVPPLTAEELPKCQRYYQKIMTLSGLNIFGFGVLRDTTNLRTAVPISVPLRTTPTVAVIGSRSFNFATNTTYTPDGVTTVSGASPNQIYLQTLHSVSMGTVGTFMQLFGNTATDYISFDAEIY